MRTLGAALLLALTFASLPAAAHRLNPAYFGLTETAPGRFAAVWKVSTSSGLADVLVPRMPAGCSLTGRVRSYAVEDAQIQHGVFRCPDGLAGGTLTMAGLAQTSTDVLLRIAFLDGRAFTHRARARSMAASRSLRHRLARSLLGLRARRPDLSLCSRQAHLRAPPGETQPSAGVRADLSACRVVILILV